MADYAKLVGKGRKRAQPERALQNNVLAMLRYRGIFAFHIPNHGLFNPKARRYNFVDVYHVAGIPDLAVALPKGRILWVELKAPKGTQSEAQKVVEARLRALGHEYILARRVEDVSDALRVGGWIV